MSQRPMTDAEVNDMVRQKEKGLQYIKETFGIWGLPFESERDSLKRWRDIQSGRAPRPMVEEK